MPNELYVVYNKNFEIYNHRFKIEFKFKFEIKWNISMADLFCGCYVLMQRIDHLLAHSVLLNLLLHYDPESSK